MRNFRCKESFTVDFYDADGFRIENKSIVIKGGSLWQMDESGSTIISGEVHLDSVENGSWLEISKNHLLQYFEEIRGE